MKCFYHPKDDAVAVCKSCGRGACPECTVIVSGISYCKTCVETSRVGAQSAQLPTALVAVPRPAGVPSRALFMVGAIGVIMSGVAALLCLMGGFGGYAIGIGMFFSAGNIVIVIGSIVLGIGLILAGIGYLGIRRNYGLGTGIAGFVLSVVAAVFFFVTVTISIISQTYRFPYSSPWGAITGVVLIVTIVVFGVTQILWGVAHINSRGYTGNSGLTLATGIILIISGSLTASILVSFVGLVLFFVCGILALLVFLMSNVPKQEMRAV